MTVARQNAVSGVVLHGLLLAGSIRASKRRLTDKLTLGILGRTCFIARELGADPNLVSG